MKSVAIVSTIAHAVLFGAVAHVEMRGNAALAPHRAETPMEMSLGTPPARQMPQRLTVHPSATETAPTQAAAPSLVAPIAAESSVERALSLPSQESQPFAAASHAVVSLAHAEAAPIAPSAAAGSIADAAPQTNAARKPYLISSVPPAYPREARKNGWSGKVVVRVLIGTDGKAEQVLLAAGSGYNCLDAAAVECLWKWAFHPAQQGDRTVKAWVSIPVQFHLD